MKKTAFILFITGLIIQVSFAQQDKKKNTVTSDDVYYSTSSKNKKHSTTQPETVSGFVEPESTSADSSGTYLINPGLDSLKLPNSATSYDDYNDYAYSARVKRFHNAEKDASYFNETYTDPSNYDTSVPSGSDSPDVNVYLGAGIGSFYGPSFSFGIGWGCNPWYWDFGWGYPFYPSWYWNYYWWPYMPYWNPYGYWNGYWTGYWTGYWDGYYGYPYGWNTWDYPYVNTYYGRRRPITSPGGIGVNQRSISEQTTTHPERNQRIINPERNDRSIPPNTLSARTLSNTPDAERKTVNRVIPPPSQQRYQYTRSTDRGESVRTRTSSEIAQKQQPQPPKYVKPEVNRSTPTQTRTQTYSSPVYKQPKSSQEYLSPRSRAIPQGAPQQTRTGPPEQINRQVQPLPRQSTNQQNSSTPRQYSVPNRTNTNSKSYSTPGRSYNIPNSSPSRSGSSAAPSRSSGNSYSAPSRSSGNSGSGGGFGGRRK
jgi:hypothetical protein